jgi:hypothetical protein
MLLNIYRADIVICDRICIGDFVQVKHGPMASRRGVIKGIRDQGMVEIEQEFASVASNVRSLSNNFIRLFICCRFYVMRI